MQKSEFPKMCHYGKSGHIYTNATESLQLLQHLMGYLLQVTKTEYYTEN